MKKMILMVSMLLCVLTVSHADVFCDCCYDDGMDSNTFYAEVLGGANFLQTQKSGGIKNDYQTGYIISGSLGYRWCYGLRVEGEYAYRRNSLRKIHFFGRSFHMHGHFQSSSYMANLIWDLPLNSWGYGCWKIKPFIGGGIGYDNQQVHAHNDGISFKQNKKQFAWQVIAGLGYPVFCNTDISLEYKFHQGGFKHIYNHSLGVGLTYTIGHY
jgi:opacity protein-like surface antigen